MFKLSQREFHLYDGTVFTLPVNDDLVLSKKGRRLTLVELEQILAFKPEIRFSLLAREHVYDLIDRGMINPNPERITNNGNTE